MQNKLQGAGALAGKSDRYLGRRKIVGPIVSSRFAVCPTWVQGDPVPLRALPVSPAPTCPETQQVRRGMNAARAIFRVGGPGRLVALRSRAGLSWSVQPAVQHIRPVGQLGDSLWGWTPRTPRPSLALDLRRAIMTSATRQEGRAGLPPSEAALVKIFAAGCTRQWAKLPPLAREFYSSGGTGQELQMATRFLITYVCVGFAAVALPWFLMKHSRRRLGFLPG